MMLDKPYSRHIYIILDLPVTDYVIMTIFSLLALSDIKHYCITDLWQL